MDQGFVPMTFSRPPQGAMAGEALVVSIDTHPSAAARLVRRQDCAVDVGPVVAQYGCGNLTE